MAYSYKDISTSIEAGKLLDAIDMLHENLNENRNPQLIDSLQRAESTYRYMLKYMREGQKDPSRNKVVSSIREDLLDIAAIMADEAKESSSTTLFSTGRRLVKFSKLNFAETLGRFISADATIQLSDPSSKEYKEALSVKHLALRDLFTYVWTLPVGSKKELKEISGVVADNDIAFSLRGVVVGALVLSLLREYDRAKFNALLSISTTSSDERIKARSLTGIALALDLHPSRIGKDENLRERFEALTDDLTFYTRMREVVYALVKARGGMKFLGKMKSEILPDIQKIGPDFINKLKNSDGEISIDALEENPEWENMLKASGMEKKLRRLNDMQTSGADMMLTMFEQVSRNFLFNDIDMWFRPFESWEADRLGIPDSLSTLMESFRMNPGFCDTDKYAMISNLQRLPEAARNMLQSGLDAQAQQMAEEFKEMMLHTKSPDFALECYNFSRNLFRFHTFFRQKNEFFNPFTHTLHFFNWPFIGKMLSEREILTSVGEYYFAQGFYEDAATVFDSMADHVGNSLSDEEDKFIAFCRQKSGSSYEHLHQFRQAITRFEEAFNLMPEDEWLAKKIVKHLHVYKDVVSPVAVKALKALYQKDKDNLDYLIPLAEIMYQSENKKYDAEFGKLVERAVYLAPDDPRVIRLQAKKYLIDSKPASEAQELLTPLIDNADMYLASASLNFNFSDTCNYEDTQESKGEELQILTDLCVSLLVAFMEEDTTTVLSRINSILSLPVLKPSLDTINEVLEKEFRAKSLRNKCEELRANLPLFADALKAR